MKIVNAMFSKVNGGLEQVFLNYIPTLTSLGNQVISVIHPQAEILEQCPKKDLIRIHNFNQHDFYAVFKLRQLLRLHQPDCIITHSYRAAYLIKKTRTKIPKIAVCHVKGHYNFGADAIIALTETMRQEIIAAGIHPNRVYVVPNMIPISEHISYQERRDFDIPVIGACARFAKIKGIDIFINALAELKRRNVPFRAKIAGDGPERADYERLIQQHGLQHDVELLGWVTDRDSFYDSLDIFCLSSREESFGLVVLEAMTHSLPLVLPALSGPLEIISDSNSALFVPPEDPLSMAGAIERLCHNRELLRELSISSFKRGQYYSTANVGPMLQDTLMAICGHKIG